MHELRRRHRPAESGFTLFEVVVAVAVLGLVFTTALGLLAAGLRSAKASTDYTHAVLLARRKLDERMLQDVKPGFMDGSFSNGYRWTAEVSTEGPDAQELPARLFKVRVTVFWPGRGKEKRLELVTLAAVVTEENLPSFAPSAVEKGSGRRSRGSR